MTFTTQLMLIAGFINGLALGYPLADEAHLDFSRFQSEQAALDSQTMSICGEVFDGSSSGGIFYKPFEQISKNERCVWIVATPGAVGYNVEIQYLGVPTNQPGYGQELIITGARPKTANIFSLNTFLPETTGLYTVSDSNLLIITFVSSSNFHPISSGFVINFQGILSGNITKTSTASKHHLFQESTFEHKYPTTSSYASNELAAFVFLPTSGNNSVSKTQIWYKRNTMEPGCADILTVFKYRSSLAEKWAMDEIICGNVTVHSLHHDDISLMLFQSDSSRVYAGFWLYVSQGEPCY